MVRWLVCGCLTLATVVGKLWGKSERIRPAAVSLGTLKPLCDNMV